MPDFTTYPNSDFPPALKWQALAFIRVQWPSVFAGNRQFVTEPFPPELGPVHFVASEGELLISYAAIIRIDVEHARNTYKTYGFGNMLTFPSFREKGFGGQVLDMATGYIKHSNIDVAILFCDRKLEGFYSKRGWELTRSPTRIGTPNQHKTYDGSRMMLFVSSKGRQGRKTLTRYRSILINPGE
jgi:GNAT superfamily N-acetyltransferase